MPVSKPLLLFMKKQKQAITLVVDGGAGWREPAGLATNMIYCEEKDFCQRIGEKIPKATEMNGFAYGKPSMERRKMP